MDSHNALGEFLLSRRGRLTPAQAGLPDFGGRRRVSGLRREEVALLAGMSVEYYKRLERGNANGVSAAVLEGVCRALQLDEAERSHFYDLVRAAPDRRSGVPTRRGRAQAVRPVVQQLLDGMRDVPAFVQNGHLDVLAANPLARAVLSPVFDGLSKPGDRVNLGRFAFLDPAARSFHRNWDDAATQNVALLRREAGRSPDDQALTHLVGELSLRSEEFRRRWAAHDVREHRAARTRLLHPVAGELDLACEGMELTGDPGLVLIAYLALDQASQDRLSLLASWSVTPDRQGTQVPGDERGPASGDAVL